MREGKLPFALFFVLDAVYMLTITTAFSVFIYAVNNGGFRWYLLIGAAVGMAVYFHSIGRIVMLFSETIVRFIRRVFAFVVLKPICFVLRIIKKTVFFIGSHTTGPAIRGLRWLYGYAYTEMIKRRMVRDIRFADDKGKGREL